MEIVRVLAPNPSPYTGPGTNTYVIHDGVSAAILDPGPVIASHSEAIERALDGLSPKAMIVTHNHSDHAPLANPLAERLGVPSFGYGPGPDFTPDTTLGDGDEVEVGANRLTAIHTPGHTADHLCFLAGTELFTGDHIMGGSTVVIEDAAAYFDSLYKVATLGATRILPGHGDKIDDAAAAVAGYIEHRKMREHQIVAAVSDGATTPRAIAEAVYGEVPVELLPAAAQQVVVQLEKLISDNRLSLAVAGPAATGILDMRVALPGEGV